MGSDSGDVGNWMTKTVARAGALVMENAILEQRIATLEGVAAHSAKIFEQIWREVEHHPDFPEHLRVEIIVAMREAQNA